MFRPLQSLRLKLTLWHVAVFSGLQVVLIGGLILWRGHELADPAIQKQMREAGMAIVENVLIVDEPELTSERLAGLVPVDTPFAVLAIRDENGRVLSSWNTTRAERLPFTLREKIPAGPRSEVFSDLSQQTAREALGRSSPVTVMTMPFRHRGTDLYLQGGVSASTLRGIYAGYFDLLLAALPIGMLASFLAAWLIAGRAVRPIRNLSSAARRVTSGGPGNRLLVDGRDHEIRVLQRELNETLERLEQNLLAQQRFVSNLSHEVKTPIAVLLTESQILKLGEASRAQLLEFVQLVETEMQHLGQLVETLLELMRAEHLRGFPHGEAFSLEDVILGATEHLSPLARASGVRLDLSVPSSPIEAEIHGDPRLVRTALENLLRNAITHSPPGSAVLVRASEEAGTIRTEVVDRGPGIPEECLERVFERFFRVPGTQIGTGLGLSIARTIVDLHHGRIWVRNNPEGGCTFTFVLPTAHARTDRSEGGRGSRSLLATHPESALD